jgi:hypothetical protein
MCISDILLVHPCSGVVGLLLDLRRGIIDSVDIWLGITTHGILKPGIEHPTVMDGYSPIIIPHTV